ncbi:MAG: pyridoxamine 5'-phosphate oxidase family protein [Bacteroidota bacterium]
MKTIFHAGEIAVQKLTGEQETANLVGRMIKDELPNMANEFIRQQQMVIIGSSTDGDFLWTSMLLGERGFAEVKNPKQLEIYLDRIYTSSLSNGGDIFLNNIKQEPKVGLLFIDLGARRRYRTNGQMRLEGNKLVLSVEEAYVNCPKFIQRRYIEENNLVASSEGRTKAGTKLHEELIQWIRKADTFFVASKAPSGSTDVSHRGGLPGFVEITETGDLRIPDYPGNSMYNTLGNIHAHPYAGLLFVDFEEGKTLQLTGKAMLEFGQESESDLQKSGQTGRFWIFSPTKWILTENHHPVSWEFKDYSPFNPS